jgi:hypothetical protein
LAEAASAPALPGRQQRADVGHGVLLVVTQALPTVVLVRHVRYVNLTPRQLDRMGRLMDTWSVMWDKRRFLWIAAEDAPDGEQTEEADLDVLLTRMEHATSR